MPRRVLLAVSVIAIVASISFGAVRLRPVPAPTPASIASPYSFNTPGWVAGNSIGKWGDVIRQAFSGSKSNAEQKNAVLNYITLSDKIASLNYAALQARVAAPANAPTPTPENSTLAQLEAQRSSMQNEVETIIEGQVARVVADQGLASQAVFEYVFPPVNFKFDELPSILIVSPKDRIEINETFLLKSHLTDAEIARIESGVEELGYSALVDNIGGIAMYPTMLPESGPVRWMIPTVAHEWLHHYFFFHALGQKYGSTYEMTTINETAADIGGNEIGAIVLKRFYGIDVEEEQSEAKARANAAGEAAQQAASAFDFNKYMNSTRVAVDAMLAAGQTIQAEQLMEQKRQELVQHGYLIRKLNQAYFAFHGSYASGPGTPNPLGQQVQQLRKESASIGDFIKAIAEVSSPEQLQQLVASKQK